MYRIFGRAREFRRDRLDAKFAPARFVRKGKSCKLFSCLRLQLNCKFVRLWPKSQFKFRGQITNKKILEELLTRWRRAAGAQTAMRFPQSLRGRCDLHLQFIF